MIVLGTWSSTPGLFNRSPGGISVPGVHLFTLWEGVVLVSHPGKSKPGGNAPKHHPPGNAYTI
jgi:hypothetical protein